jgi:hypothetical protein
LSKDFAPKHERSYVAPFHQRPGNHPGAGAQSRKTIEVDIVEHASAVQ